MYKTLFTLIIAILVTSCNNNKSLHFVILGQYADIDTGMVYLTHYTAHNFKVVDSTIVHHDGSFKFEGDVPAPELYGISVIRNTRRPASFFVEDDTMCVKVWESCNDITVQHSEINDIYLRNKLQVYDYSFNIDSFVNEHPESPVTAYFLSRELSSRLDADKLQEYRNKLSSDLDECVYVKKIESLIENMQNLRPGTEAKDFKTKDIDGNAVSLSALRGKKVILHFWASWCSDCRQELSAMRNIYRNSDKNKLKIIGISINSNIPELRKFISQNEIEWQQVCDEKEWMSPIAQQYAVRAVPTLVVIDEKGKIVTSGNSVSEIEKALK